MDKLFNMCDECQQYNSLDTWIARDKWKALTRELKPFEKPSFATDDPRFLWLKYQILKCFDNLVKL